MTPQLNALLYSGSATLLVGLTTLSYQLATIPLAPRPSLGNRGLKRTEAILAGGLFALMEPTVRYFASWCSRFVLAPWRRHLRQLLMRSGDYLGLSDDELLALSLLSSAGVASAMLLATLTWSVPLTAIAASTFVAAVFPFLRVATRAKQRAKQVTRSLPGVIELAAMCMGAGLDFPGSLRRIIDSSPNPTEPIIEELRRVLQELDLGRTRRKAMAAFADRVPTPEVRQLVSSVVQAEEKGSPLSRVLTIQAQTLRLRRSAAAEEVAAEAALMLVGPMTLIFLCIIVLLLGPVVVRAMTGGMGAP